ncbi:MAG: hypothetical protein ACFB00_12345 [Parvularculaceae bacterium]
MRRLLIVSTFATSLAASAASAQALAPMRGAFASFADTFRIRLTAFNPYDRPARQTITVYDEAWRPLAGARAMPQSFDLAPRQRASVAVTGSFDGAAARGFYVCNASPAATEGGARVKGEVCGKYYVVRRGS